MNDYREIISKNIKRYRKAAGMSQVELAKELGITSASISNWEKGQNSIDIEMLFRLCSILNVSIDDMGSLESPAADQSPSLTPKELSLVLSFRKLNSQHQDDVLNIISGLNLAEDSAKREEGSSGYGNISDGKESSGGCA